MKKIASLLLLGTLLFSSCTRSSLFEKGTDAIDYVDVQAGLYGSSSQDSLKGEALPIIQLPNALLRTSPLRESYKSDRIYGFSLFTPTEEGEPLISMLPLRSMDPDSGKIDNEYIYDEEKITPYSYQLFLTEENMQVDYTLASRSGLYNLTLNDDAPDPKQLLFAMDSTAQIVQSSSRGFDVVLRAHADLPTRVYMHIETNEPGEIITHPMRAQLAHPISAHPMQIVEWRTRSLSKRIMVRYGISLVDSRQAQENMQLEIPSFEFGPTSKSSRNKWQNILGKIELEGGTDKDRRKFYTALYKSYLYPTLLSEGNLYYSPVDDSVHISPDGRKMYASDRSMHTYETTHPLHLLLTPELERDVLSSHIEWLEQAHGAVHPMISPFEPLATDKYAYLLQIFSDAYSKGLMDTDPKGSYNYLKTYALEHPSGTTSYDLWCLGVWADHIGKSEEADRYQSLSRKQGMTSTDLQAHDVQHLLEYNDAKTYPLAIHYRKKVDLLMRSIPYLENITPDLLAFAFSYYLLDDYVHAQKYSRLIIDHCFGNDYQALPGEDHYGALSSSLVFAMMGIFPVAPGVNAYMIGVPLFSKIRITMEGGNYFEISAPGASSDNKYSTEMALNGKPINHFWIKHSDIAQGGKLSWRLSHRIR